MKKLIFIPILLFIALMRSLIGCEDTNSTLQEQNPDISTTAFTSFDNNPTIQETTDIFAQGIIDYNDDQYGFTVKLPISWEGYTTLIEKWCGYSNLPEQTENIIQTGPEIIIRNPTWSESDLYQDIPIMIFTHDQWEQVTEETDGSFHVSATGVPPAEIGRNFQYIFALPPRYNFMDIRGVEEVWNIINNEGFLSNENLIE